MCTPRCGFRGRSHGRNCKEAAFSAPAEQGRDEASTLAFHGSRRSALKCTIQNSVPMAETTHVPAVLRVAHGSQLWRAVLRRKRACHDACDSALPWTAVFPPHRDKREKCGEVAEIEEVRRSIDAPRHGHHHGEEQRVGDLQPQGEGARVSRVRFRCRWPRRGRAGKEPTCVLPPGG